MPASIRDQLQICTSMADIEKFISIDQLPKEYGGNSPYALGESPEEKALQALIEITNSRAEHQIKDQVIEDWEEETVGEV